MIAVGIDIGTSNIELTAINLKDGTIKECFSSPNLRVNSQYSYAYLQDPVGISTIVETFLQRLSTKPVSIGITGQVHGILYTDTSGLAVSKLYTWLDQRGGELIGGSIPRDDLFNKCGKTMPVGYGLLTHYANRKLGVIPKNAANIQGICEYVTGCLIHRTLNKTDQSCLSAFGAWDTSRERHYQNLISEILPTESPSFLSAAKAFEPAGKTDSGISVAYPVGDNQAGFFCSIKDVATECLVSIGTSGQLTLFTPRSYSIPSMELRPFLGLGFLQVGATLSAGKSYETLERFIFSVLQLAGLKEIDHDYVYGLMKTAGASGFETPLTISTAFKGTRIDETLRGSISGIGLDNFNLGNLVRGTIAGIVKEITKFSKDLGTEFDSVKKIIVTGDAVKKNPLFIPFLEREFKLDVLITESNASIGAAIIGAISADIIKVNDRVPLINKIIKNNYHNRMRL